MFLGMHARYIYFNVHKTQALLLLKTDLRSHHILLDTKCKEVSVNGGFGLPEQVAYFKQIHKVS